ncbi:MAG: hypothetical protein WD851_02275 [Pirellulales bacterium]
MNITQTLRRDCNSCPKARPGMLHALLAVGCLIGCDQPARDYETEIAACADLPGARASENSRLQQALRDVELAHRLPQQMIRQPPPDEENAAVALAQVFNDRSREQLDAVTHAAMPTDRFEFDEKQLVKVKRLLRRWETERVQLAAATKLPRCGFAIDFERGYFAEHPFLTETAVAVRLALLECVPSLVDGDLDAAQRNLSRALRWIGWLADEQLLEAKVLAARLRGEALLAVEAIAWHPLADPATWRELLKLLQQQLDHWPSDEAGLIGDRARSLHAYEVIRRGMLDLLLTLEERAKLVEDEQLDRLQNLSREAVDLDEALYLETMQKIIALSDVPFFERQPKLAELYGKLESQANGRGYPELAMRLFLADLVAAQEQLARDRGRYEGWAITLAAAVGDELPPYTTNPLNGHAYEVRRTIQETTITLGDADSRDPGVPALPRL